MTRVLVVDDDPDVLLLLQTILGQEPYDVVTVTGGRAALAVLKDGDLPHVVILDVQMPDMNGWATLAEIRRHHRTAALPVILCTVKASPRDMEQGWSLGCDGYLTKPFSIEEVSNEIEATLSRSQDERARRRKAALEGIRRTIAAS
jgi:DNA-binding response OmpR family regulator